MFAQALIDGQIVRASAKQAGIHRHTAFRWRHRFLAAPAQMQARRSAGIAEADETFMHMHRSYKGSKSLPRASRKRGGGRKKRRGRDPDEEVAVLVMRDREGHTLSDSLDVINAETIDGTVRHHLDRNVNSYHSRWKQ